MLRTVVFYLLLIVGGAPLNVMGQHPQCDLKSYASPYVRVLRKRNGPPIAERTSREFLDLREHIHRMLCINGPVILYEDHRKGEKFKNQFTKAKMKFYTHECLIINQIKTSKVMELRAKGISRPTLKDVNYWDIIGQRATGIFLMAKSGDYTQPVATFLTTDNLEFLQGNDTGVNAGSFATIGPGPFCLRVDNLFDIIVGGMPSPRSVCQWSFTGSGASNGDTSFRKRYHKIFNGQKHLTQFEWVVCPGRSGLGPFPAIPPTTTEAAVVYDHFAIMNPSVDIPEVSFDSLQRKSMKLSKRSPLKSILHDKSYNIFMKFNDEDYDLDNPPDFIITVNPSDCITIPNKPTSVPPSCGPPSDAITCTLFERALDIPQKPGATVADPTNPPSLDRELTWKRDVLYIVSEIFGQICKAFPPDMPYTVGRLLEYYVARAHEADPEIPLMARDKWKYLTNELSRCMINVKKANYRMLWYWDNRDDRETFGPEERPQKPPDQFLDIGSPVCKAMECSSGCQAEDDKCVPFSEFSVYCFSLGIQHCQDNTTLCYINKETGVCDLALECEAMECEGDDMVQCVSEGDTCMETYVRDNFIAKKSMKGSGTAEDLEEEYPNKYSEEKTESGSQGKTESDSEGTTESDSEVTTESDSEVTTELDSEVTTESDSEVTTESNSVGKRDLDSEEKTEPDSVRTTESDSVGTTESDSEGTAEPNSNDKVENDFQATGITPLTFVKVQAQEVFPVLTEKEYHYDGYPINVMSISNIWEYKPEKEEEEFPNVSKSWRSKRSPRKSGKKKNKPTTLTGECLFFYEEAAEIHYELNVAIDIYWKIYAAVIGYCNKEYPQRKSETFPNLYSMFHEDFLEHVMEEWRFPKENEALKSILNEFNSEVGQRWLDVCLESAYLVSNSSTYRPPRPVPIGNDDVPQSNYFLQLPEYLTEEYLWQDDSNFTMVSCPD